MFISESDGRCSWLLTTAEHDVVWSIWVGDRSELSCAHLNGECQFHMKSHQLIDALLACPLDWARGPPSSQCSHHYAPSTVCHFLVARQLYPSCRFSSAEDISKFPTLVGTFTQQRSCTVQLLTDKDSSSELHLFVILFNFDGYLCLDTFPRYSSCTE